MPDGPGPKTSLRRRLEHSQSLDAEARLQECVDYLENPQILVAEFADSFLAAEAFDARQEDFCAHGNTNVPRRRWIDQVVQCLVERESVEVAVDPPYRFRYVAREIVPLWSSGGRVPASGPDRRAGGGLDYLGVIDGDPAETRPVLGVIKPRGDPTTYLSLLRLLTCLAEVSTEPQMERASRFLFKGVLPPRPTFDLHLVVADWAPGAHPHSLMELTHDLADRFAALLKDEWHFPDLVRSITCLSMSRETFDGRLEPLWRV